MILNKNKSCIIIIKGMEEDVEIEGYPVIIENNCLGIMINNKLRITKHIGDIGKKLKEYFSRNFILNKRYFSVKSIMQIFGYFHKSRLLYGLPAFIDQKSKIEICYYLKLLKILSLILNKFNQKYFY